MASDPSSTRLGRGLGSMFDEVADIKAGSKPGSGGFMRIPITDIRTSLYNREPDQQLCESVKKLGVLQPILVAQEGVSYKLLAGSRRLQAAGKAGLADIPVIVIPPDRAGSLDVFLEENLSRADFNEQERKVLRDQWMKETGRDEEQAAKRIPDIEAPAGTAIIDPSAQTNSINFWRALAGAFFLISIALIVGLSLRDTSGTSNGMDETIAAVLAEEFPHPDTVWMELFSFPGSVRSINGSELTILPAKPAFNQNNKLTQSARLFLYQLAAVLLSSDAAYDVMLTGHSDISSGIKNTAAAAAILESEGVPSETLILKPAGAPMEMDNALTVTVTLR